MSRKKRQPDSIILPKRAKALIPINHDRIIAFCQQAPTKRTITFESVDQFGFSKKNKYFLSFPWVNFFIEYSKVQQTKKSASSEFWFSRLSVGLSTFSEISFRSYLYRMTNYTSRLNVCLGATGPTGKFFASEEELIEEVISYFWQSCFGLSSQDDKLVLWRKMSEQNESIIAICDDPQHSLFTTD